MEGGMDVTTTQAHDIISTIFNDQTENIQYSAQGVNKVL